MGDFERFILDNLNIILVIAFIVLPVIFNRKKMKKKTPPTAGPAPSTAGPGRKPAEESLEGKVRKFFEEIVEKQAAPRPVQKTVDPTPGDPAPEPVFSETLVPEAVHLEDELLEDELLPDFEEPLQAEVPIIEAAAPPGKQIFIPLPKKENKEHFQRASETTGKSADYDSDILQHSQENRDFASAAFRTMAREDIRKAIVWKEILDRPVGLRSGNHSYL